MIYKLLIIKIYKLKNNFKLEKKRVNNLIPGIIRHSVKTIILNYFRIFTTIAKSINDIFW